MKAFPVILLLCLVSLTGCGPGAPPNLLLISVDTLRLDALSTYGSTQAETPNLDELARSSVVLEQCYTTCPRTTQSFASLLTGLYPANHGAHGLNHRLEGDLTTLAERLQDAGYRTEAVVSNRFLAKGRGFEQGFELYDDRCIPRESQRAEDVRRTVEEVTRTRPDRPYFLWVHFMDPHWPYQPPEEVLRRFTPEPDGLDRLFDQVSEDLRATGTTKGSLIFENRMTPQDRQAMRRRYQAEVAYVDHQIGLLLEFLEDRGLLDSTVILIYSDHGESLGEHDYYYAHGEKLYQPTVQIPAFIRYPGVLSPGRYDGLAANPDLLPTLLNLLGLEPPPGIDGIDLADALRTGASSPRLSCPFESDYQFIHPENPEFHIPGPAGKWRAVLSGSHKLIRIPHPEREILRLYDLAADPGETRNLAGEQPEVVARLRPMLDEWEHVMARQRADRGGVEPVGVDQVRDRELRSLGYLN